MRRLIVLVGVVAVGCTDPTPTSTDRGSRSLTPSLSIGREGAPPIVLNTQLRSDTEIPLTTSESKGHAQLKVLADGTIQSHLMINNKGAEVVRFCHIHWINPTSTIAGTGPVIWWLTSPTGSNLALTDAHIEFSQNANFVSTTAFPTEAGALAAFLEDPSDFYVNCHSNAFPPGFIRGNLP